MTATRPRPPTLVLPACLVMVALCGCFTIDGTVNSDGSGSLVMRYRFLPEHATAASETRRFTSPWVSVSSVAPDGDSVALTAAVRDVSKLASAEGFGSITVSRQRSDQEERLRIVIDNRRARAASAAVWPDPADYQDTAEKLPAVRISLTLPGEIRRADGAAVVRDRTATWTIPMLTFARAHRTKLSMRYRVT